MDHALLMQRAELAGQWALANQCRRENFIDYGRYSYGADRRKEEIIWCTCWLQGVEMMALLALHEATGKQEYLDSAAAGSGYLRMLQHLDSRKPANFGYIVESKPLCDWGHPRDALTAAWALLLLNRVKPRGDLMDRVLLFADWFAKFGMCGEYPAWTVYMDGRPPFDQRGSFHGGSCGFFNDLHDATGESRWLNLSRRIADYHIDHFLKPDGSLRITLAPDGKTDLTMTGASGASWEHMHMFNDDFTALAMLRLGELTGQERYTEAGLRFTNFLVAHQQSAGGFGDPIVSSATGTGALTLVKAAQADPANRARYVAALERAMDYLLAQQETEDSDPRYRGAFYAEREDTVDDWKTLYNHGRSYVILRTIAYSTSALAQIGGRCRQSYYNVSCADI